MPAARCGGPRRGSASGVEHGDYNGTELFGVGTDRFIWMAYQPNGTNKVRLFSGNFPKDGVIEYTIGNVPAPKSAAIAETWGRFPYGIDYILKREGFKLKQGIDGVLFGNIPGGGMSRSASLCINLILSLFDVNGIEVEKKVQIVDLAQAVENDYIGSPCGKLDQTMVLFAKEGMGTYYNPKDRSIEYVPIGKGAIDFRIVVLDTGTDRPGLEKATYAVRRRQCEELVGILQKAGFKITCLADVKDEALYDKIMDQFGKSHADLCDRLNYIYHAQQRFYKMMDAWRSGDDRDGRRDLPAGWTGPARRLQDLRAGAGNDVRHRPHGPRRARRANARRRRQGRLRRPGPGRERRCRQAGRGGRLSAQPACLREQIRRPRL